MLEELVALAIGGVMIGLLTYGLNRGGRGKEQEGAVVYKPRTVVYAIFAIVAGLGLFLWGASIHAILAMDWTQTIFEFVIGLPLLWLALFGMLQSVTLNAEAIRYDRWYLRPITIAWHDLHHYEIARSPYNSMLVLRPRSGIPSMALNSYSFDVNDVLRRIKLKTPIKQQALRKQKWWRY